MDKGSIIDIIQLASIIITGSLGIAGTITHTRDAKGNLTKWGVITVIGIMITNSFSFIQSYLKQQKDKTDQIANLTKEHQKAMVDSVKYQNTMHLLDSSLNQQFVIQTQSKKTLLQIDSSIRIQDKTFKQSQVLNNQQRVATDDIERSLSPLVPFKIDLKFLAASSTSKFSGFTKSLNDAIENSKNQDSNMFAPINLPIGKFYLISPGYKNYNDFVSRITFMNIVLTFSRHLKDGSLKTIKCNVDRDYFTNRNNLKDFQFAYNATDRSCFFILNNLPVNVIEYAGEGFNSTKDLQDATLEFQVLKAPGSISNLGVKFKFPPDYSRISNLLITNKGNNAPEDFFSNYSVTTRWNIIK